MNQFMDLTRLPLEHDEDETMYALNDIDYYQRVFVRVGGKYSEALAKFIAENRKTIESFEDVHEILHPPAPKTGPLFDPFDKRGKYKRGGVIYPKTRRR
jgi:hypothetical protein